MISKVYSLGLLIPSTTAIKDHEDYEINWTPDQESPPALYDREISLFTKKRVLPLPIEDRLYSLAGLFTRIGFGNRKHLECDGTRPASRRGTPTSCRTRRQGAAEAAEAADATDAGGGGGAQRNPGEGAVARR